MDSVNAKLTMVAGSAMNVRMDFITIQIVTVSQRNILLRAHCYTDYRALINFVFVDIC